MGGSYLYLNNIFKTFLLSLLLTFGLGVQSQVATFPHTSDFEGSLGDWVNPIGDNGDFRLMLPEDKDLIDATQDPPQPGDDMSLDDDAGEDVTVILELVE